MLSRFVAKLVGRRQHQQQWQYAHGGEYRRAAFLAGIVRPTNTTGVALQRRRRELSPVIEDWSGYSFTYNGSEKWS